MSFMSLRAQSLAYSLMVLTLSACQHAPVLQPTPVTAQPSAPIPIKVITAPQGFTLTGKIGVKTPQQSGSAFYAWAQTGDRFAIDLSGALGIGQTHIEGVQGHVTLDNSTTGHLEAQAPETLLKQATGWDAPISSLRYWVMGVPAATPDAVSRDNIGRLQTLTEQGWHVRFEYSDAVGVRPQKLVLTQPSQPPQQTDANAQAAAGAKTATATGENRVILTVQTRTESP